MVTIKPSYAARHCAERQRNTANRRTDGTQFHVASAGDRRWTFWMVIVGHARRKGCTGRIGWGRERIILGSTVIQRGLRFSPRSRPHFANSDPMSGLLSALLPHLVPAKVTWYVVRLLHTWYVCFLLGHSLWGYLTLAWESYLTPSMMCHTW